jgi:hypothetical protein
MVEQGNGNEQPPIVRFDSAEAMQPWAERSKALAKLTKVTLR